MCFDSIVNRLIRALYSKSISSIKLTKYLCRAARTHKARGMLERKRPTVSKLNYDQMKILTDSKFEPIFDSACLLIHQGEPYEVFNFQQVVAVSTVDVLQNQASPAKECQKKRVRRSQARKNRVLNEEKVHGPRSQEESVIIERTKTSESRPLLKNEAKDPDCVRRSLEDTFTRMSLPNIRMSKHLLLRQRVGQSINEYVEWYNTRLPVDTRKEMADCLPIATQDHRQGCPFDLQFNGKWLCFLDTVDLFNAMVNKKLIDEALNLIAPNQLPFKDGVPKVKFK